MAVDHIIAGLDIGTSEVSVVIGELDEKGALEIIGVGTRKSNGLRRGVVVNIEAAMQTVAQAVEEAEMMSGKDVVSLVVGIAGGNIEGFNSRGVVAVTGRGREIAPQDVNRVIEAAKAVVIPMDREVIHVIPQEYIVDDQGGVKNPVDMIGVRLEAEVHIITGSVSSARNLIKCVNRAGFRVDDIVLESLAASNAVLSEDEKELGVLLIDLGGGTTDVMVQLDGAPYHTHVIPIGGSQVTSDISIMLKIPVDMAEKVKVEAACCYPPLVDEEDHVILPQVGGRPPVEVPRTDIARIIQPRMEEILVMVKERITEKGFLKQLSGGVVLTGGGALMPGIVDLAQDVFGLPTRVGYPRKLGGLVEEYHNPKYGTAVGLVLYELENARKGIMNQHLPDGGQSRGVFEKIKKWIGNFF